MQVTITEASRLVNKATVTLYRHIKKGRLSRGSDGMIDTAELIRCYGALNGDDITHDATGNTTSNASSNEPVLQRDNDTSSAVITLLQAQIQDLQDRADKADQREERLMKLLEVKLLQDNSSDNTLKKFKFW